MHERLPRSYEQVRNLSNEQQKDESFVDNNTQQNAKIR